MNIAYIKLAFVALLPAAVAVVFYLLDNKTSFKKMKYITKQIIYGIAFGAVAVLGTEWGIPVKGAVFNCRDAAVLISGLMFGAPAGIIAGLLGGIERWIAVAWGVGSFTRLACSLSTIIAGIYSAALRKYMFEDKKPGFLLAFAIGVVMEVFHMVMVFITNMATPNEAMEVVRICAAPMILANGASVMIAGIVLTLISKEDKEERANGVRISQTIQRWLMMTVLFAFITTSYFIFSLQNTIAVTQANKLLTLALDETQSDIERYINPYQNIAIIIRGYTRNRHVGETGYILIFDQQDKLISSPDGTEILDKNKDTYIPEKSEQNKTYKLTIGSARFYCQYRTIEHCTFISIMPEKEALQLRNIALYVNCFMEILVFAVLFGLIYLLIKQVVVKRIKSINASLAKITGGDLNEVVNVRSNTEFASLSDDINSTVDTLKRYIDEASARIDEELEFAKNIQLSALPSKFPAFPKRKDFDIYAHMDPAKEVGGDFYDFYLTGKDNLNFLIADVSGKGIPAAMFMMRAKTELKTLTESELPLNEVFTRGNDALCDGNAAGMFVTAWQGSLDLETGVLKFANAGHNPPLVRHGDGKFEYLRNKAGFVLAGMEGVPYKTQEIQLSPGDVVFLYTDGVTEATNVNNELYGEERLLTAINSREFDSMGELCGFITIDVDTFVDEAPQFDDMTMVALKYIGTPPPPSIHFDKAEISDIPKVTDFLERELEKIDCPMKTVVQLNIAIDEMFSNIVKYGYKKEGKGPVTVKLIVKDDPKTVNIRFEDRGIPYNPLTKQDPDVTLSAEDRTIGGLGIYLVKKSMDDVKYRYENGMNILTLQKYL